MERSVEDAVGRQRFFIEGVLGDQLVLLAGLDDDAHAVLAQEIDLAVGRDRRRGKIAADLLTPDLLAGEGVEAADDRCDQENLLA